MTVQIRQVESFQAIAMTGGILPITDEQQNTLSCCLVSSREIWIGYVDQDVICLWGLIPPTLLSNEAYLWLLTTKDLAEHKFVFVRYSQRAIEEMLKIYDRITGHCSVHNPQAIQWVKWLGGVFGEPFNDMIPFTIRRKPNG